MSFDEKTWAQIREARGKFLAMAATYSLGVFNDNFFRNATMLLIVEASQRESEADVQGIVIIVFTLPYLLFAWVAGWLADRLSKRTVVIGSKLLELLAMLAGAAGICLESWPLLFTMMFTMGLQSCIFGPSLNGSIPELYPAEFVTRANARLKVATTVAILTGVLMSALALSLEGTGWAGVPQGRWVVAIGAVAVSMLGVVGSFGVPRRPAAAPEEPFPWNGPINTFRQIGAIRKDRLLWIVVKADVFVWFSGSLMMPLVNALAVRQLGRDTDTAGYILGAEIVGVAIGGTIGGRLASGPRWYRVLPWGTLGMSVPLLLMLALPALPVGAALAATYVLMGLAGVAGGLVLVPCEAFVQVRPDPGRKGSVIAAVSFLVFCGIALSGFVDIIMKRALSHGLETAGMDVAAIPSLGMGILGAAALAMGLWLRWALRKGNLQ